MLSRDAMQTYIPFMLNMSAALLSVYAAVRFAVWTWTP